MKQILYAILSILIMPIFSMAQEPREIDGVAAYVNKHIITISDVIRSSRTLQEKLAKGGDIKVDSIFNETLNELIDRKLILDDYDNQKKVKIPESVFTERADAIIKDMFNDNHLKFIEALNADGLSEDTWRSQMRERTIVGAMRNLRVDSKVTVSPLAARERYDANREKYTSQPSVKMRMISIAKGFSASEKKAKKKKLNELLKKLKDNADFTELAKSYSEDSYASDGGDRGWMKRDMLRSDLADAAFSTKVGDVTDVIDIGKQFCIIKVDDKVDAKLVDFEDAKPLIEHQIRVEQSIKLHDAWIGRLRKNAYIKIVAKKPLPVN